MAEPSLGGVWAKIARAKAHREALDKHISRTFARKENHPRIGIKFDPEARQSVLYVSRMKDVSPALEQTALIAGDLINNLRSALDHLTYQIAVKCTRDSVRSRPQFPICDFRRRNRGRGFLDHAYRKGDLREVRGYWARLESFQPYRGRNYEPNLSLRLLRDYNNRDKHNLLIPSVALPSRYTINLNPVVFRMMATMIAKNRSRFRRSGTQMFSFVLGPQSIYLGAELYRLSPRHSDGREVKVVGEITPTISLGEHRSAVALCDRLIEQVTRTIVRLEGIFE